MFDVTVVGAGPAGVSCALWLKQLGFRPVVIDRAKTCGGLQLTNPYVNTWIATNRQATGSDLSQAMHENLMSHGIEMRMGVAVVAASLNEDTATVLLASGERVISRLLVLATGVVPRAAGLVARKGLLLGPGHAVANTDFTGARVAILGGGDNAFENHGFAKGRGAASVQIFARTLRARAELLERVPPQDVWVGDYWLDSDHNTVNGEAFDHVLVLYGFEVSPDALLGLDGIRRTDGFISTDGNCQTSHPLVYAIGEIAGRMHPCCVTSMADGVVAAKAIQRRLESAAVSRYHGLVNRIPTWVEP